MVQIGRGAGIAVALLTSLAIATPSLAAGPPFVPPGLVPGGPPVVVPPGPPITPPGLGGGGGGGGGGGIGGGGGGGGGAKAAGRSGGGGAGPWPVWVLGISALSIIIRGAVVWNTECRELTLEEALGGTSPLWPVFHKPRSQCPDALAAVPVRPRKAAVVTRY